MDSVFWWFGNVTRVESKSLELESLGRSVYMTVRLSDKHVRIGGRIMSRDWSRW